MTLESHNAL